MKQLKDGDYKEGRYIYCDGILTHVKKSKKFGLYTYFVGKIADALGVTVDSLVK